MGRLVVYDLEVFENYHSAVFFDVNTKEYTDFVMHSSRNDFKEYYNFLKQSIKERNGFIGYNNLGYDYPILHYIIDNYNNLKYLSILELTKTIFNTSQRIINDDRSSIPEWKIKIPQMDLYRIHHFNNKAKATSLKHLEVVMRLDNVEDLPFPYDYWVKDEDVNTIQKYCQNDVHATYQFYLKSLDKINFRKRIKKEYGINCINYPDVKIGEEILIVENSKALNIPTKELRKMQTHRKCINVKDIILPYIKYKTEDFNNLLDYMKSQQITSDSKIKYSIIKEGVKYDYGQGGIHGIAKKGIYKSDNDGELINCDVSSYYPNIAIRNRFYPQHMSSKFCDVGEKLFNQRMEAKKNGDTEMVAAIKLALNGALFGKSNDIYSCIYDRKFFFSITINGQLLLSILAEQFILNKIPIVQVNTDGKLELDYDKFNLIAQRDVNNYLAVYNNGKVKYKGAFEIEKLFNKDHSMLIVPIALREYLVNDVPIHKTITEHDNIFDFMKSQKVGKQYTVEAHYLKNNKYVIDKLQRINRYFISNKGVKIYKRKTETNRLAELEVNYNVTIMNKMKKLDNYDINYDYYIRECQKIIDILEPKQSNLF